MDVINSLLIRWSVCHLYFSLLYAGKAMSQPFEGTHLYYDIELITPINSFKKYRPWSLPLEWELFQWRTKLGYGLIKH